MVNLRQSVCQDLCAYHKPGQYEDPGCAGYEFLASHGSEPFVAELEGLSPSAGDLFGVSGDDPRLGIICSLCTYPPDGCDYRNPEVADSECSPCGGLRAIAGLISKGLPPL